MGIPVLKTIDELRQFRASIPPEKIVAFVPTMGALHEGHASLIQQAHTIAGINGCALASVFVNPTQFTPSEDFNRYPRTLDQDVEILESAGAQAVFAPSPHEMYPDISALSTSHSDMSVSVDPGPRGTMLEGALRPGHFRGVCTVVLKLLNLTQPTHLVMGQKDYQQNIVLRKMISDLNIPVEHVMCPTVRESDGLARSSRNRYLSQDERVRAIGLYEALNWAAEEYKRGNHDGGLLETGMKKILASRQLEVQYAIAAHADTLRTYTGKIEGPVVLLIAAKNGNTRLIDNMLLQ